MPPEPSDRTPARMSNEQLAQKVRWEGGLIAALEYGITQDAIEDAETAIAWTDLAAAYDAFSPLADAMAEKLGVER